MKTKITFSVNSEEITKQTNAVMSAKAINAARQTAQKAFDTELQRKITEIIKGVDESLKDTYYSKSKLKNVINNAVYDAIIDRCKNDLDIVKELARRSCSEYIARVNDEYNAKLKEMAAAIKQEVAVQIKEYMSNAVLRAVFGVDKSEV